MKVFITGASGYIGSAVARELLSNGHRVLGLARSDTSAEKLKALGAEVHRGDTNDLDSIRAGASTSDAVVHTAFDHSFKDFPGAMKKDNETIEAIGAVLAGTNKPFITSSALLGMTERTGGPVTEEGQPAIKGPRPGRGLSEKLTLDLAQKGVRSAVVRFAPTVHGGPDKPNVSFIGMITAAARKNRVSAYPGDGSIRWPAANVLDVATLIRLILETGPGGLIYHATGEEGNSLLDIATVIGAHLNLPVKSVAPGEETAAHFGFLSNFMHEDTPTSSEITRKRTGWKPTHPGLLEELKAGNPNYYY